MKNLAFEARASRNLKILLSVLFSVGLFSNSLQARTIEQTAKIYPLGKTEGDPLFIQKTTIQHLADGGMTWKSEIRDQENKVTMTEASSIKDLQVQSQEIEHFQSKEAYALVREGDKVQFKTFSLEEAERKLKSESSKIKVVPQFITGPVTVPFIQSRWEDLSSGKSIDVQFGVFELERKVAFVLKKHSIDDKKMIVKLKPSNFFISMLVDPLFMEFDRETKKIIRFRGRTPLKNKVGSQWKPFDAEILYSEIEK
jgi:hypothetical protein